MPGSQKPVTGMTKLGKVSPTLAFGVACLSIATYSCMDVVMKGLSIDRGAYNAMLWRSVLGLVLSGALFVARRTRWPARATIALHAKRSVAGGLSMLFFFWGLVRVPMAEGVALTFLAPIIAILLAVPMLGERLRRGAIVACVLAFAGVLVIVAGKAGEDAGAASMQGALAIVLASLFYAYSLVMLRRSALAAGPIEITFFTNLFVLALFAAAAPLLAELPTPAQAARVTLASVLQIISSLLLAWAYAHAEAQRLAPVEFTAFVWAAILGAVVFGEKVLPLTILGAGMIIAGCAIAARQRGLPAQATEALA